MVLIYEFILSSQSPDTAILWKLSNFPLTQFKRVTDLRPKSLLLQNPYYNRYNPSHRSGEWKRQVATQSTHQAQHDAVDNLIPNLDSVEGGAPAGAASATFRKIS